MQFLKTLIVVASGEFINGGAMQNPEKSSYIYFLVATGECVSEINTRVRYPTRWKHCNHGECYLSVM